MNTKRIFVLAMMVLLCLPVWAMAEASPTIISDIPHYIDENGTVSVYITDESSVIWLQASSQGQTAWIGLDNSNAIFKAGSRFQVQWLNEQDAEWDLHYDKLDVKNASIGWLRMLDIGVLDPDGEKIYLLPERVSLYVQLEDNRDFSNLEVCYIKNGTDESFIENVISHDYPGSDTGKFVEFSTDHFSPYCFYIIGAFDGGALSQTGALPRTGDDSNMLLWSAFACISMFGIMILVRKRKEV